jgi:hypothetical protein
MERRPPRAAPKKPTRKISPSFASARAPETPGVVFPTSWAWFFDDCLPAWVKDRYSPRESWKGKPFTSEDGRFFLRGIRELSDLFTEERPKKLPDYLAHEKFRSSYLLYFLPLQASKFIALFAAHPKAMDAALARSRASGVFRFFDLGAGPGTASIATLLALIGRRDELPAKIELVLFDQNVSILRDAEALLLKIAEGFPRTRGRVSVRLVSGDMWQKIPKETEPVSLAIFGHTLNEFLPMLKTEGATAPDPRPFAHLFELTREGGGILFAEPAARGPSQTLSQLRDFFLEEGLIETDPARIWGPCLHAGRCPFAIGRDWCHFSVPGKVPGKWFAFFSKGLSKEKEWLKYSYLWITAKADPNPDRVGATERLVLTDPLSRDPRAEKQVLLCEPDTPNRRTLGANEFWRRGMRVDLESRPRGPKSR